MKVLPLPSLSPQLASSSPQISSISTPNRSKPFSSPLQSSSSSTSTLPSLYIAASSSFLAISSENLDYEGRQSMEDKHVNLEAIPTSDPGMEEHVSNAAQRIIIENKHGEKLVGILHEVNSKDLVILCHGLKSSKERKPMAKVSEALASAGISNFRFDFSGNGESEGSFQFGNYWKEVDDLRAVILHFLGQNRQIRAIVGHSKGGCIVLLYASKYHDIPKVVNVSGRFDLSRGLEEHLGKDFLPRIQSAGFIDVLKEDGQLDFRVTEESLMERLKVNMHDAALSIAQDCRVLTVHGSEDEVIPVGDAVEFGKVIPNHILRIIEGSDHGYTNHQAELNSALLEFL